MTPTQALHAHTTTCGCVPGETWCGELIELEAAVAREANPPPPTLSAWSRFPDHYLCHWRHPDGRDTVAARLYGISSGGWLVVACGPDGAERPGRFLAPMSAKRAKREADNILRAMGAT